MTLQLFPYQETGRDFLNDNRFAILADEQGLGKTAQAITASSDFKQILVVCPATLKHNWANEFRMWAPHVRSIAVVEGSKFHIPQDINVCIVNYDLLIKKNIIDQLHQIEWDVIICDEAHYLKNMTAKRTKAVLAKSGLIHKVKRGWFLTGTPMVNRPIDMYPLLSVCFKDALGNYSNYKSYGLHFCAGWDADWGFDVSGASNLDELREIVAPIMMRREKANVLHELPHKRYQMVALDLDNKSKKDVKKEENNLDPKTLKKIKLGEGLQIGDLARLRSLTAEKKLPVCIEYIRDWLSQTDKKLVLFAHHKAVIKGLAEDLSNNYGLVVLDGETSPQERERVVEDFQTNPDVRIFIGNIKAAGVGITLTAASDVMFVETSYVPGDIQQAVDRCHRIGQEDSVLAQFLVAYGTIEETMLRTALDKLKNINQVIKETKMAEQKGVIETLIEEMQATRWACERMCDMLEQSLAGEEKPKQEKKASAEKAKPKAKAKSETKTKAKEEKPEEVLTQADVRTALKNVAKDGKEGPARAQKILGKFKVSKVSDIPEDKYAEVMAECEAA